MLATTRGAAATAEKRAADAGASAGRKSKAAATRPSGRGKRAKFPPPQEEGESNPQEEAKAEEEAYVVEALLQERTLRGGRVQYLVSWEGYGAEYNTWEPREELLDTCGHLMDELRASKAAGLQAKAPSRGQQAKAAKVTAATAAVKEEKAALAAAAVKEEKAALAAAAVKEEEEVAAAAAAAQEEAASDAAVKQEEAASAAAAAKEEEEAAAAAAAVAAVKEEAASAAEAVKEEEAAGEINKEETEAMITLPAAASTATAATAEEKTAGQPEHTPTAPDAKRRPPAATTTASQPPAPITNATQPAAGFAIEGDSLQGNQHSGGEPPAKRARGRPRLTDEEKAARKAARDAAKAATHTAENTAGAAFVPPAAAAPPPAAAATTPATASPAAAGAAEAAAGECAAARAAPAPATPAGVRASDLPRVPAEDNMTNIRGAVTSMTSHYIATGMQTPQTPVVLSLADGSASVQLPQTRRALRTDSGFQALLAAAKASPFGHGKETRWVPREGLKEGWVWGGEIEGAPSCLQPPA